MIGFIEFDHSKCDSCYKCLRICPTKAISFNKDTRHIIDNLCIKCGVCQQSCPREALKIRSCEKNLKTLIEHGERVAVSIAPSFAGAFGLKKPMAIVGALKSMGVDIVEETAIGAQMVAKAYDHYVSESEHDVHITSCCPSANYLIEQHYPTLIKYMLPVVSPMIAHGKSIKERYGSDVKVVFIGPCMAKMAEAEEIVGAIDMVMTFDELNQMIRSGDTPLSDYEEESFNVMSSGRGRAFPLGGSLNANKSLEKYRVLRVDGIEACKSILAEIRNGSIKNSCIEINICEGSCMNGPDMPQNHLKRFARELYMHNYIEQADTYHGQVIECDDAILSRSFSDKQEHIQEPNVMTVRRIMSQMGKYTSEDELNCGACGYKSCYDKAMAVFKGYSDVETCLPYLRDKAESMQNVMIENSPNVVMLINKELNIVEVNPSFNRILNKSNLPFEGLPVILFANHDVFEKVRDTKTSVQNKQIYIQDLDCYFLVNVIYLADDQQLIGFLTDITAEEKNKKEYSRVKEETLLKTQEVIDKQMRVAQEIASLLGETTAETKMSLKSLNELVMYDWSGADGV